MEKRVFLDLVLTPENFQTLQLLDLTGRAIS